MERSTILTENKGFSLTYGQVVDALRQAGLEKGDTVCVHSDLLKFGMFKLPQDKYMQAYIDALLEVIGEEGTLLMPTFSYSFCKGEIYNVQSTKSTVGSLTEYFRKLPNVVRNAEPIFSFAICGKNVERYLDIGEWCFAEDSAFGKMLEDKAKIVVLGFFNGVTFNHFIEAAMEVPYRFMKRFYGTVVDGEKEYETYRDYYVRYLDQDSVVNQSIMRSFLKENNLLNEVYLGEATISCLKCDEWFVEASRQYKENPYFFVRNE